jgi:hypothetical protein
MVRLFTLNRSRNQTAPLNNRPMKMRLVFALTELTIGFGVPVFAQQKDAVDPQALQQLSALSKKTGEAFSDAAALAAFYTAIKRSRLESKLACSHSRCIKN